MTQSLAVSTPSESRHWVDKPHASPNYKDYVEALCPRNPSLLTLHGFLSHPRARRHGCRLAALDFRKGIIHPISRQIIDVDYLPDELHSNAKASHKDKDDLQDLNHPLQGRILIIEDLTVDVVERLGIELDIDPLFFALHLHTTHRTGMRNPTPDEATLPSRLRSKDYINISYHRPVTCRDGDLSNGRFVRDIAIDRKLVFLRSTKIGLAQHRASVIKVQHPDGFWLAVMLVDPPLASTHFLSGHKDSLAHQVQLDLLPFLGNYENFAELPKFSEDWKTQKMQTKGGTLDDVIQYWEQNIPACFDPENPTIQSLAYYPLRIIAAEWVKYVDVMHTCIKQFEYQGSQLPDLTKFNMDLHELQAWRRRAMRSQEKIQAIIRRLTLPNSPVSNHLATMEALIEDFMVISSNIKIAGRRLESMLPVVTSLVQIIDARQSFMETANISRLTILAFVFVPLTFVSSLFSMNSENLPGNSHFWVYFVVAIPVTLVVFIIARLPKKELRSAFQWAKDRRKQRSILKRSQEAKNVGQTEPRV